MFYEIQDINGIFFQSEDLHLIQKIWDTNMINNSSFYKKYKIHKEKKHIIPKWVGDLRLVAILDFVFLDHDKTKVIEYGFGS